MKIFITFFIFITSLATANEVSVFGAGDLNSTKPYGLNSTEKYILKNKKELGNIDSKVKNVKFTLESINERIDGLESIYEGQSQTLNDTVLKFNDVIKKLDETSNLSVKNSTDVADLKNVSTQILNMQEEISSENKKNLDILKDTIKKLTSVVNTINSKYVSDSELKSNMKQFITIAEFNAFKKSLIKTQKKKQITAKKNKKLTADEKKSMLTEAKKLFKKDYFTKAIPLFETLVEQNYKPAESNFYLGEIWYYRKRYKDAISYFKKSAVLYDKASWMPKLLLHSAISFENVKDYENATSFYSTLVDVYPDSEEAKIATKNLSKI